MAPDVQSDDDQEGSPPQGGSTNTTAAEAALKAKLSRKRTKTGCLTCRKRRIKCGEEHPVCKNCIKSKRDCEGYSQRVVFKPPHFDFRPVHNGAHITFQANGAHGPAYPYQAEGFNPERDYSQMPQNPMQQQFPPGFGMPAQNQLPMHAQQAYLGGLPQPQFPTPMDYGIQQPFNGYDMSNFGAQMYGSAYAPSAQAMAGSTMPLQSPSNGSDHSQPPLPVWTQQSPQNLQPDLSWPGFSPNGVSDKTLPPRSPRTVPLMQQSSPQVSEPWIAGGYIPRPELSRPIDYQWPVVTTPQLKAAHQVQSELGSAGTVLNKPDADLVPDWDYFEHNPSDPDVVTPTHMLIEAAVEVQDDDYNDVHSDDEMDMDTQVAPTTHNQRQQTFARILETNQISIRDLETRRYDTFLYSGILDHYRVEQVANPLRNPATARVFAHFVAVTGPSLSIFQRHPRSTSLLFDKGNIPSSKQGLWTYTMPMAALQHQGLLHAMLALASLHIARLTGTSVTPSMQHYAWALKRIHHCVGHPQKRLKLTTVAASLLLGFYEVITAEHVKWNMHLAGSKQLFIETDFIGMTRQLRKLKREKAARQNLGKQQTPSQTAQDELLDQILDVDDRVVSIFSGKEVNYNDPGHVVTGDNKSPKELDLSRFEILKDLYWWYCKQDVYQSIISGNGLLMSFDRWADCPPRAPLGRPDAVYGSFDHLILLLARLADFAHRDRSRKLRQMKANGGQWRPAAGMKMPRPPAQNGQPKTPMAATRPPQGADASPDFYGMAPPPRSNVQMPSSYNPKTGGTSPQNSSPQDTLDLEVATQNALEEYGRIRAALHTFSVSLGKAFEPLSAEYQIPIETPFGNALQYRSHEIGVLWGMYNMAVIIAIRSHPHMPPAAHMAAGVAAQETHFFAQEIGRISAGIVPGPENQPLNPTLGAALCESTMPSFFAAVQYQDPQQRDSTVRRILSIAKRTGWGSAELIAHGCETAWVKAASMGRGPPYTRIGLDPREDPRLHENLEEDPSDAPNVDDYYDRRFVRKRPHARLTWASGIVGTEDDTYAN